MELGRTRRSYQYCLHFMNFMTPTEWRSLRSPALKSAKIAQLAARAWSIGLRNPAEKTSFAIAEILCYCHGIEGAEAQSQAYGEIKAAIKELSSRRKYPCEFLVDYPVRAAELPVNVMEFAYGGKEAPVDCSECIMGTLSSMLRFLSVVRPDLGLCSDSLVSTFLARLLHVALSRAYSNPPTPLLAVCT